MPGLSLALGGPHAGTSALPTALPTAAVVDEDVGGAGGACEGLVRPYGLQLAA
eukprot:CAMPEP_0180220990 /NCGR_PEP_ID=MMETSP0987-20121128/19571_1 /TAXON_ID=697907 /ORGANISM="non described non described, Strain CCMP2293" /LENGTH=52 /DNA_ID=CAMNT_0022182247 /DNA_START=42 /DNA_END=196 /DNA_ORIENTATION=-